MIEISIAVIAGFFALLVIYLIVVLRSTRAALDQLTKTLQVTELTTIDVKHKLHSLDSFFQAFSLIGDKTLTTTKSFMERGAHSSKDEHKEDPNCAFSHSNFVGASEDSAVNRQMDRIMDWVALGVNAWKIFKKQGGSK